MRERFDKRYKPLVWIRAVDLVERNLPEKMQLFLKARRMAGQPKSGQLGGRPGWVVRTQMEYAELAGDREDIRAWVGERTIKSWWSEIVLRVIICQIYLTRKK